MGETGETARLIAKFHPDQTVMAVAADNRIARQIEGYMCSTSAIATGTKRGDGAHVRLAFDEGKKRGLFADGDSVVCVHTTRNEEDMKQFMVRILYVTSGDIGLKTLVK